MKLPILDNPHQGLYKLILGSMLRIQLNTYLSRTKFVIAFIEFEWQYKLNHSCLTLKHEALMNRKLQVIFVFKNSKNICNLNY